MVEGGDTQGKTVAETQSNEPRVTFFTDEALTAITERDGIMDVATFPKNTTGIIEIFMTNPTLKDPDNIDPRSQPGGSTSIKVALGRTTTTEPLRGVSRHLYFQTGGSDYDLLGYKIATTAEPTTNPEAEALGPTNPTQKLIKLFGNEEAVQQAIRRGLPDALRKNGHTDDTSALPIKLDRISDAFVLVGVPKMSGPGKIPTVVPTPRQSS